MAYIHCGNKNCNWSQDDFYIYRFKPQLKFWKVRSIFGYQPWTIFIEQFLHLILPRWIHFDKNFIEEIFQDHNFRLKTRTVEKQKIETDSIRLIYSTQVWSWSLIRWEWKRMWIKIKKMKWKTYEEYKNDPAKLCPKCGYKIPSSCID